MGTLLHFIIRIYRGEHLSCSPCANVYATYRQKKERFLKKKGTFLFFIETCNRVLYISDESIHLY